MDVVWLSFVGGLLGGSLGAAATLLAARLRETGAKREEWWRRVQWAADLALGDDLRRREAGLNMLVKLAGSQLASADDVRLLAVFADPALTPIETLPNHDPVEDNARESTDGHGGEAR